MIWFRQLKQNQIKIVSNQESAIKEAEIVKSQI